MMGLGVMQNRGVRSATRATGSAKAVSSRRLVLMKEKKKKKV